MDKKIIEDWLKTDDGKQWEQEFKKGLLSKNNELIQSLKQANGNNADTEQRLTALQKELEQERAALKAALLSEPLAKILEQKNVFKILIPEVVNKLAEVYDLYVEGNGEHREAIGTIDGKELTLDDIVDTWANSGEGKEYINPVLPGQIVSTAPNFGTELPPTLKGRTGQQLAAMTDDDFEHVLKQEIINGC